MSSKLNRRPRMRLTYANLVATIALLIAISGTAYAAIVVTGANVKDNSLTSADIKDGTLTSADLHNPAVGAADLAAGAALSNIKSADGPGSGLDADLVDGHHASDFQTRLTSSVVLHALGSAAANGAALLAAMATLDNTNAALPRLLVLEPGYYDIGSGALSVKPNVTVVGAGNTATVILGSGPTVVTTPDTGINGAVGVRDLSVSGSGTGFITGVSVPAGATMNLDGVDVAVAGSSAAVDPIGDAGAAVAGTLVMRRGTLSANNPGGGMQYALALTGAGSASLDDVDLSGRNDNANANAIYMSSSANSTVRNSTMHITPNADFGIKIGLLKSGTGTLRIDASQVMGQFNSTGGLVQIGGSQAAIATSGSITCTQSYDSTYTEFVANTCHT